MRSPKVAFQSGERKRKYQRWIRIVETLVKAGVPKVARQEATQMIKELNKALEHGGLDKNVVVVDAADYRNLVARAQDLDTLVQGPAACNSTVMTYDAAQVLEYFEELDKLRAEKLVREHLSDTQSAWKIGNEVSLIGHVSMSSKMLINAIHGPAEHPCVDLIYMDNNGVVHTVKDVSAQNIEHFD